MNLNATTASPTVAWAMEYDAFGREIAFSSTTGGGGVSIATPPFRFSTKYTDGETGLVYYGYRYYAPEMGRWLSRDPIGERGGNNLYAFLRNDGVNKWDILGREELICNEGEHFTREWEEEPCLIIGDSIDLSFGKDGPTIGCQISIGVRAPTRTYTCRNNQWEKTNEVWSKCH
jgi:RHS repeat-associated protein